MKKVNYFLVEKGVFVNIFHEKLFHEKFFFKQKNSGVLALVLVKSSTLQKSYLERREKQHNMIVVTPALKSIAFS